MKRRLGILITTVALLSGMLSGCTIGNTEFVLDKNEVGRNHVFSVNGENCTKEEARLYLCNYQNLYGHEYGINLWEHDFGEVKEEESLETYVKSITLSELAGVMCMNQLAEQKEIALTNEEKDLVAKATDAYYDSLSKDEIRFIGLDKSELKNFYEKYAVAQKLYQTLTQGVNEEVSDDEARVMQVQQIFVKDKETAESIQQKLSTGADFSTLAGRYNEADEIEVYVARGVYPQEVEDVVFRLQNEEVSAMLKTENGYYFIKCLDKFVEDLTEANKENIVVKRREEQFDDVFRTFIEESDFDLNEQVWSEIKVDTSGIITTNSFFSTYDMYFKQ